MQEEERAYHLLKNSIVKNKVKYMQVAELTEDEIKNKFSDSPNDLAKHLTRKFGRMFAHSTSSVPDPAMFYMQTDPGVKRILAPGLCPIESSATMDFFKSIGCSWAPYSIRETFGTEREARWRELNSIQFFFLLDENEQDILIRSYCKQNAFTFAPDYAEKTKIGYMMMYGFY